MYPVACRLRPLGLSPDILDPYTVAPVYNSYLIQKEIHRGNRPLEELLPFRHYTVEEVFRTKEMRLSPYVAVEVGSGTGDFIIQMAFEEKEKSFLGIDYALPCIERSVLRAKSHSLDNLLFYPGRVEDFFFHDFRGEKFDLIMINFPDPWPKKRHIKRRIAHPNRMKAMVEALKPGGLLITATDVGSLYTYHLEHLQREHSLENICRDPHAPPLPGYRVLSVYDRKGRRENRLIFYTLHRKAVAYPG